LHQEIRTNAGWNAGRTGKKIKLRLVFDRELGEACHDDDGRDEIRREFRKQLDLVEISPGYPRKWMKESGERCVL
jgi:hypothetical protein